MKLHFEISYTPQDYDLLPDLRLPEQLKADNQMLWVRKMNNIRSRATEIVNNELIDT